MCVDRVRERLVSALGLVLVDQGGQPRAASLSLTRWHKTPPLTVPPFQAVSGSYRMRHLHASASSQETGDDPDPLHLHPHLRRRVSLPVLRTSDDRGRRRGYGPRRSSSRRGRLDSISRARVDWPDSKGLNQWERTALELAEERNQLG